MRQLLIGCGLSLLLGGTALAVTPQPATDTTSETSAIPTALARAIDGEWRSAEHRARDAHRHPGETLAFFGLQPGQTVVEITPGGGWYAEILAPYLRDGGTYVAAIVDPQAVAEGRGRDYQQRSKDELDKKFAASSALFDQAKVVGYNPTAPRFGADGSADVVLTFRNVHNWRSSGQAQGMFEGFFAALKPGGVLGVVEHRANSEVPDNDRTGYVAEAQVIALAEAAGFVLDARSEINANPKDTKDHPNGVWTLPPGNNHPAEDADKYRAIGESDRMTLRFVKPASK